MHQVLTSPQNLAQSQEVSNNNQEIKCYLRVNLTKKGFDFKCQKHILSSNLVKKCKLLAALHHLIQENSLPDVFQHSSKYILIHMGRKVIDSQQLINLEQSNIIYIVNKQEVQKPLINIYIRFVNKNRQTTALHHFKQIKSGIIISAALSNIIPLHFNKFIEQVDFFHLGKVLQTMNYFCQEYVQNQAEITCIDKLQTPQVKCYQRQQIPIPVMIEKKKFITKQQSIQILGITEMPYKPTISYNELKKTKKNDNTFVGVQHGEQIIIGHHQIINAQAMEIQQNPDNRDVLVLEEKREGNQFEENIQYSLINGTWNNTQGQNANGSKQQIKTKEEIQGIDIQTQDQS